MLDTIAPLVIVALLPCSFVIHYTYLKRQGKDFNPIVSFYVSMFLLITYAILPSVCTTIFGTFSPCLNVDPEGLLGTYSLYLPKDLSISCNSSRYHYGIVWASVMVVVYPVGIPCLYLYLLFLARAEIKIWKEKQITESTSKTLKVTSSVLDSSIRGNNGTLPTDGSIRGKNGSAPTETPVPAVEQTMLAIKKPSSAATKNSKDARIQALNRRLVVLSENNSTLNNDETPPPPMKVRLSTKTPSKLLRAVSMSVMLVANNHAAKVLSDEGMLKYIVSELEFLHRDYREQFWFWEIILMYDKLLMTAVISIILPGSHDQILIAWIMAFIMMRVQTMASPYLDHYDDSLKKIADYQIMLFLFIAIIKVDDFVSGAVWEVFLNVIMFFLIFSSPIAAFWYAFIAPSETVASLRKDYREQKAKAFLERQSQTLLDAMNTGNIHRRGDATTPRSNPRGGTTNSMRAQTNGNTGSQRVNNSQRVNTNATSQRPNNNANSQRSNTNPFSQRVKEIDTPLDEQVDITAGGGLQMIPTGDSNDKPSLAMIHESLREQSIADAEFSTKNSMYETSGKRKNSNSYIEALPVSRRQSTMLPPIRGSEFPLFSSTRATQKVYVDGKVDGSMTQKMFAGCNDNHDDNDDDDHDPMPSATSLSSQKLLQPLKTTDLDPSPTILQTSIKEHLTAMHTSGKELVDRLRTSGKSRDIENPWASLLKEGENEIESQQALLAVFAEGSVLQQALAGGNEGNPYRDDNDDNNSIASAKSLSSPRRHHSLPPIHKG